MLLPVLSRVVWRPRLAVTPLSVVSAQGAGWQNGRCASTGATDVSGNTSSNSSSNGGGGDEEVPVSQFWENVLESSVQRITLMGIVRNMKLFQYDTRKVARFQVETHSFVKKLDGGMYTKAEWHSVSYNFSATSPEAASLPNNGDLVHLAGRLGVNLWEDQSGKTRSAPQITVSRGDLRVVSRGVDDPASGSHQDATTRASK